MPKRKKQKRNRPLGEILLDIEPYLIEMCEQHDLQHSDVLYLIKGWLDVHWLSGAEEYVDNDQVIFYYGSKKQLIGRLQNVLRKAHNI